MVNQLTIAIWHYDHCRLYMPDALPVHEWAVFNVLLDTNRRWVLTNNRFCRHPTADLIVDKPFIYLVLDDDGDDDRDDISGVLMWLLLCSLFRHCQRTRVPRRFSDPRMPRSRTWTASTTTVWRRGNVSDRWTTCLEVKRPSQHWLFSLPFTGMQHFQLVYVVSSHLRIN